MVSYKCTTYGRVEFLEEALQCFLLQENTDCELIIVNDYPLQKLIYNHPKIKIFNLDETFKYIGDKDNFAIENSQGDVIGTFDDDDLYMPNHTDNIYKYFVEGTNMLHWRGVFYNHPVISSITGIGNSGMVYSRDAWEKVGRHPIMNAGGDSVFSTEVHKLGNIVNAHLPDEEVSAWYRWKLPGPGVYHQSGQGTDKQGQPNIIERHTAHIESLRFKGLIPTGNIHLKPRWKYDYLSLLKNYINKK